MIKKVLSSLALFSCMTLASAAPYTWYYPWQAPTEFELHLVSPFETVVHPFVLPPLVFSKSTEDDLPSWIGSKEDFKFLDPMPWTTESCDCCYHYEPIKSPVPELNDVWMLLAGLVVVFIGVRRK